MKRLLIAALSALAVCLHAAEEAAPERLNVVIFVADDMGWGDVGYHGSEIETPNIDRLVREGVELDRFYAFPICSPTRAALLTGRSPLRFGITGPLGWDARNLPVDEHLLPQGFRAAGYQTFMVGKWHLGGGSDPDRLPHHRGFDHCYGCGGGVIDYYEHSNRTGRTDWHRNGEALEEKGYSTDLLAAEASRLLRERDRKKPVLLYVAFNAPHGPHQAPDELVEKYRDLGRGRDVYAATVDAMDRAIGRVLSTLDGEGLKKSTLVVFFSDNGAPVRGGAASNGTLRGGKGATSEGGIRVPAVMRWPGVLEAGTKSRQVISVLDLFPTLAAAAGVAPGNRQPFDGRDVWPAIRAGKTVPREGLVISNGRSTAVFQGPWKLLHEGARGSRLYRIAEDPAEERDLAAEHPQLVGRLQVRAEMTVALLPPADGPGGRRGNRFGRGRQGPLIHPLMVLLDTDRDRVISAEEMARAVEVLRKLDANGDGRLTADELPRRGPGGRPGGRGGGRGAVERGAGTEEGGGRPERPRRPPRPAGE
ncbi:MAG: sulfatase-like hydrolase/transferase [Planctomycetota bacterium]|nr:sulfatase-like hydrolase/transferase [Planctomycetota bacterium]